MSFSNTISLQYSWGWSPKPQAFLPSVCLVIHASRVSLTKSGSPEEKSPILLDDSSASHKRYSFTRRNNGGQAKQQIPSIQKFSNFFSSPWVRNYRVDMGEVCEEDTVSSHVFTDTGTTGTHLIHWYPTAIRYSFGTCWQLAWLSSSCLRYVFLNPILYFLWHDKVGKSNKQTLRHKEFDCLLPEKGIFFGSMY